MFKYLFISSILFTFLIIPALKVWLNQDYELLLSLLNLMAFTAFLFCIHLISKNLAKVEKQRFNKNNNIFVDFILIWLLPIGIWFIAPRMRTLLYEEADMEN